MSVLTNSLKHESHELSLLNVKGLKLVVLRALSLQYKTRATLHKELDIRISTLCGVLKRLENEGWVRVAFDERDPETNRMVAVYTSTTQTDNKVDLAGGIVERHWIGDAA
jgi:DNA-binding MarR family transcriptional regulator